MRRTALTVGWWSCALAACAVPAPRPVDSAETPQAAADSPPDPLVRARARRADLEASPPPPYAGDGSKAAAKAYYDGPLTRWIEGANQRYDAVLASYAEAATAAPSAEAEIDLIAEALGVAEGLTATLLAAGRRAAPAQWHEIAKQVPDLDVQGAFDRHLERAAQERWQKPVLERCVLRADARAVHSPAAARCRASLARVRASLAAPDALPRSTTPPPSPAWVATTVGPGCVYAGSVKPGPAVLSLDPAGKTPIATLDGGSLLVVDRLELPADALGRAKAVLSYPVLGTVWLDPSARPLTAPRRVEAVPGHAWLEAGARMNARLSDADHVRLSLSLAPTDADAQPAREAAPESRWPAVRVPRAEPSLVVGCADLKLSGSPRPQVPAGTASEGGAAASKGVPGNRWVALYDDAGATREVARVRGPAVITQLGKVGGFTRVAYRWADVSLDGWARSSELKAPEDGFGMIGIIRHIDGAAGAATRPVAVRLAPDASAPVVFDLAPGAAVYLRSTSGDFDEIAIGELAEGTQYYVPRGALDQAGR